MRTKIQFLLVSTLFVIGALLLTGMRPVSGQSQFSGGGGGTGGGLPAGLSFASPTLTVSSAGNGNGALALSGNTSGTATLTAPAVAGTVNNPVVSSNAIMVPAGTSTLGGVTIGGSQSSLWAPAAGSLGFNFPGNNSNWVSMGSSGIQLPSAQGNVGWSSSASQAAAGNDTNLSRDSAGVVDVGSGAVQNTTGKVKAAGYMSAGTTFTGNAGCAETLLTGGATAGSFKAGATGCTIVITMGNSATAPNGWSCSVWDTTTTADTLKETAFTTTTVTLSGTVAVNDIIIFNCMGF